MKVITLVRIHIRSFLLFALLIPLQGLAITQTRVSQINQFLADLSRGKFTTAESIKKQEAELKKGLSSADLTRATVVKRMNQAVKDALAKLEQTQQQYPQEEPEEPQEEPQIPPQQPDLYKDIAELKKEVDYLLQQEQPARQHEIDELKRQLSEMTQDLDQVTIKNTNWRHAKDSLNTIKNEIDLLVQQQKQTSPRNELFDRINVLHQDVHRGISKPETINHEDIRNFKQDFLKSKATFDRLSNSIKNSDDGKNADYKIGQLPGLITQLEEAVKNQQKQEEPESKGNHLAALQMRIGTQIQNLDILIKRKQNITQQLIDSSNRIYQGVLDEIAPFEGETLILQDQQLLQQLKDNLTRYKNQITELETIINQQKQKEQESIDEQQNQEIYKKIEEFADFIKGESPVDTQEVRALKTSLEEFKQKLNDIRDTSGKEESVKRLLEAEAAITQFQQTLDQQKEDKQLKQQTLQKLNSIKKNIEDVWYQPKKVPVEIRQRIEQDLREVSQQVLAIKNDTYTNLLKDLYNLFGQLTAQSIFTLTKETKELLREKVSLNNLFEALENKEIDEAQYIKAVNARIALAAAVNDGQKLACVNVHWISDWSKDLGIYLSEYDKDNIQAIRDMCEAHKTAQEELVKEQEKAELKQYEAIYQKYLKTLGGIENIDKGFMDNVKNFEDKLHQAEISLQTDKIETIDFKEDLELALAVINRQIPAGPRRVDYQIAFNRLGQQIKYYILEAIIAHRKITKLEQLPEAVQGKTQGAVAALDLLWQFKSFNVDQFKKENLWGGILNMIADLQDLNLGFPKIKVGTTTFEGKKVDIFEGKPNINNQLEKDITKELIISWSYVCASFDSLMYKLVTTQQGFAAWAASWILSFVPYIGRSYTKEAYYNQFEQTLNYVLESINNGIKILELTLKPLIGESVPFKSFEAGSLNITTYVPSLKQNDDYKYGIVKNPINKIIPVGANSAVALPAPFIILPIHKKNKLTAQRIEGISLGIYSSYDAQIKVITTAFADALRGIPAGTLVNDELLYVQTVEEMQRLAKEHPKKQEYAGSDTEMQMQQLKATYESAIAQ